MGAMVSEDALDGRADAPAPGHAPPEAAAVRAPLERLGWLVFLAAWAASTAYVAAKLPALPTWTNDSMGYLEIAAHRPPAYGWFLHALGRAGLVGPEHSGLPLVQTGLISAGLLAFGWQLARLLRAPWLCLAALLVWAHAATFEATRWLASEGLFLPLVLFGCAASIAYARRERTALLVAATACFGLSALTRTSGAVFLLLPVLLVALDGRLGPGAVLRRTAVAAGVSAVLLGGGMWSHLQRHGHFEIGSNAGISLLGKALLVLPPGPHADPVSERMAPLAARAREAVDAAPGFLASLRAQAQAYEALRWPNLPKDAALGYVAWIRSQVASGDALRSPHFFSVAAHFWPEFTADGNRGMNAVAGRFARATIADQPLAFLRLVARDWIALGLYPHFWPFGDGGSARLPPFDACDGPSADCWALFRHTIPLPYALAMPAVSAAGLLATLVLFAGWGGRALRRALAPPERAMVSFALVAQASLAATALFEAGLWRYALPVHVVHIALAIWLAKRAAGVLRRGAPRVRAGAPA